MHTLKKFYQNNFTTQMRSLYRSKRALRLVGVIDDIGKFDSFVQPDLKSRLDITEEFAEKIIRRSAVLSQF